MLTFSDGSMLGRSRRIQSLSSRRRRGTKSKKRSVAAKKTWDKRTRREGIRQVIGAVASEVSMSYGHFKAAKDSTVGMYKVLRPRRYRRNKWAKRLDKIF